MVEAVAAGLFILVLIGPSIAIALSGRLSPSERMVWGLTTFVPVFVAAGLWLFLYYVIKPGDGMRGYTAVAGLIAIWGPWLIFAAFKKRAARERR